MLNYPSQKVVTVCDKCLTETCCKGQFPCAERLAGEAGSVTDTEENISHREVSEVEVEASRRGLEAHGPFEVNRLTIDGYEIPHLTGKLVNGRWYFTLDNRFGVDVPERDGCGVAWIIATALAVGAGYSCFGENSRPANPFKTRLHCIAGAVSKDSESETSAGQIN